MTDAYSSHEIVTKLIREIKRCLAERKLSTELRVSKWRHGEEALIHFTGWNKQEVCVLVGNEKSEHFQHCLYLGAGDIDVLDERIRQTAEAVTSQLVDPFSTFDFSEVKKMMDNMTKENNQETHLAAIAGGDPQITLADAMGM